MRRLIMLVNLRKYLTHLQYQYKDLKSDKLCYLISKFCYITSADLKTKIQNNLPGFSYQLGIQQLINLIKPIY
jgi:hypothetical protein